MHLVKAVVLSCIDDILKFGTNKNVWPNPCDIGKLFTTYVMLPGYYDSADLATALFAHYLPLSLRAQILIILLLLEVFNEYIC